jgi:hypothetical protein
MGYDLQKPSLDHLARYLTFLLGFAKSPRRALQPYAGKGRVDSELLYFAAIGVVLSEIISLIAGKIGVIDDPSGTLAFILSFGPAFRPLVAVVIVFLVTLAFHAAAKGWIAVQQSTRRWAKAPNGDWDPYLGGSVEDSMNGSFAFSAFFIPLATFALSLLLMLAQWHPPSVGPIAVLVVLLMNLAAVIYFPLSLAAVHPNTSFVQVLLALASSLVFLWIATEQVLRLAVRPEP